MNARGVKIGIVILPLFLATAMFAAPCGMHGSAAPRNREYVLNPFKNRSQAPVTVNPSITLEALAKGARFENTEAAAIIGFVESLHPWTSFPAAALQSASLSAMISQYCILFRAWLLSVEQRG